MKKQLIIFELLSGLFGWLWILSGLSSIYFLLSNDEWAYFWWAIVVAILAKWLAKGFMENKRRVVFILQEIEAGGTEEEANRKWFDMNPI